MTVIRGTSKRIHDPNNWDEGLGSSQHRWWVVEDWGRHRLDEESNGDGAGPGCCSRPEDTVRCVLNKLTDRIELQLMFD